VRGRWAPPEAAVGGGSGISFPGGPYFGDSPQAVLPGSAMIALLGLDSADGISTISVVWDETAT
jgi:hypothetical protein